jgi:hypothetical protein
LCHLARNETGAEGCRDDPAPSVLEGDRPGQANQRVLRRGVRSIISDPLHARQAAHDRNRARTPGKHLLQTGLDEVETSVDIDLEDPPPQFQGKRLGGPALPHAGVTNEVPDRPPVVPDHLNGTPGRPGVRHVAFARYGHPPGTGDLGTGRDEVVPVPTDHDDRSRPAEPERDRPADPTAPAGDDRVEARLRFHKLP